MIELVEVSKRYGAAGARWAVHDLSLAVADGELIAVLGESGSGKTTVLKLVNRLLEPDAGAIRVGGRDVRGEDPVALRRTIGYVIQHAGLLPHLSVADNVAMVPRLLGWQRADIASRVDELLALVGLPPDEFRGRYPDQLSGGQRQRVGVARALAARPRLVLLDEPFGALDPITRATLQGELARIHRELGLTTLLVTHDLVEALTLADRIVVMRAGEIRQIATPHQLLTAPADDYVARLVEAVRAQGRRLLALAESPEQPEHDRG
ncbi:MAG TPA: ATP-binding cassette domain-containing protein [Kofleriaceae bacterium]|nr:ATP-binding cassette domain-containing protein [Kofleriaceae bacterium]